MSKLYFHIERQRECLDDMPCVYTTSSCSLLQPSPSQLLMGTLHMLTPWRPPTPQSQQPQLSLFWRETLIRSFKIESLQSSRPWLTIHPDALCWSVVSSVHRHSQHLTGDMRCASLLQSLHHNPCHQKTRITGLTHYLPKQKISQERLQVETPGASAITPHAGPDKQCPTHKKPHSLA